MNFRPTNLFYFNFIINVNVIINTLTVNINPNSLSIVTEQ